MVGRSVYCISHVCLFVIIDSFGHTENLQLNSCAFSYEGGLRYFLCYRVGIGSYEFERNDDNIIEIDLACRGN